MAVFTEVSHDEAAAFVAPLGVGRLTALRGIQAGIENSNFFVDTLDERGTTRHWVLTLFERLTFEQLPFYLELMRHLNARGLAVPVPQPNSTGHLVSEIKGKPAALLTRVPGRSVPAPGVRHCGVLGEFLARMHVAGSDFKIFQPHLRGIGWWKSTLPRLEPHVPDHLFHVLAEEVIHQDSFFRSALFERLPAGPIHADLFRDNCLWIDQAGEPRIGGVIDFYFAGCSLWLFDLAVTLNDWCVDLESGAIDAARAGALLEGYHAVRPLTDDEHEAWPTVLRGAALRFWMSRLDDWYRPRRAEMLTPHDPSRFERMLALRIADPAPAWVAGR